MRDVYRFLIVLSKEERRPLLGGRQSWFRTVRQVSDMRQVSYPSDDASHLK